MPDFSKYYERYSFWANFALMKALFSEKSNIRKQALGNRHRDYARLADKPRLFELHRELNALLVQATSSWKSHDYGEGYFYQGLQALGITGLRDTDARVEAMDLKRRVRDQSVLEIGCNSGFLSLAIAADAERVVGFDINPHLIRMAMRAADFLERDNVSFHQSSFEAFETEERFDVVLSFANHSTADGNTEQSLEDYFARCAELTRPGGRLLFESHPPAHEGDGLTLALEAIERHFEIEEKEVLDYGNFLDGGRTFASCRR